jgi:hypothetical protein
MRRYPVDLNVHPVKMGVSVRIEGEFSERNRFLLFHGPAFKKHSVKIAAFDVVLTY